MSTAYAPGDLTIAVCDRCNRKMPYQMLKPDGNSPGLRVCPEDWDPKDPWRLPPIQPDPLILRFPRPDVPLTVPPAPAGIDLESGLSLLLEDGGMFLLEDSPPQGVSS